MQLCETGIRRAAAMLDCYLMLAWDYCMSALTLMAGPRALAHVRESGLNQQDFRLIVGASGGPKWFVLYGLDRYLFGEFFAGRTTPLATMGTSAGAWRLACLARKEPVAALDLLARYYSQQTYSASPDRHEVSREARQLLDRVLGDSGAEEIAANPLVHVNILANRARRPLRSEHRHLLTAGLAACGLANMFSRRSLSLFLERVVFHNRHPEACVLQPDDLPTRFCELQADDVKAALMATGSIPLVMEGVTDVSGMRGSLFRDGGIIDYHFDLPFCDVDGLVLYPHFYAGITPGWFDKLAPWRRIRAQHFDNVLLVAPSAEFVASLPYGKIPDRKDFETLSDAERLAYWDAVLSASARMGEEFARMVDCGFSPDAIQPLSTRRVRHLPATFHP